MPFRFLLGAAFAIAWALAAANPTERRLQNGLRAIVRLPVGWLDEFAANVRRVTLPQVRNAFARRNEPSKCATVIVGAPEEK